MANKAQEDVTMVEAEQVAQKAHPSMAANAPQGQEEHKQSRRRKDEGPVETPEELKDDFEYESRLGEGTYGVVYKATDKRTS